MLPDFAQTSFPSFFLPQRKAAVDDPIGSLAADGLSEDRSASEQHSQCLVKTVFWG